MRRTTRDHESRTDEREQESGDVVAAGEGPTPQPELHEPRLSDPGLTDLSKRDYFAIIVRA